MTDSSTSGPGDTESATVDAAPGDAARPPAFDDSTGPSGEQMAGGRAATDREPAVVAPAGGLATGAVVSRIVHGLSEVPADEDACVQPAGSPGAWSHQDGAGEDVAWTRRRRRLAMLVACGWLGYLIPVILSIVHDPPAPVELVVSVLGLALFVVCYVHLVRVGMMRPFQLAAPWALIALVATSALLMWPIGSTWRYAFPFYLVAVLPGQLPRRWWAPGQLAVVLATIGVGLAEGDHIGDLVGYVGSVAAVAVFVSMFFWMLMAMVRLRMARAELARLAVANERLRIARDLHDVLGHRLAAVALKSDLARRLVDVDRERAVAEMAAAGQIAREALDEVRATVSGFRDTSLSGELSAARSLLAAAGVECVVAQPAADLPGPVAEVAGWVVREGVTNVVRHARASQVWITVRGTGPVVVEILDNGRGPAGPAGAPSGNGLRGLSERVAALGGTMRAGRQESRYQLLVELPLGRTAAPLAGAG